MANDGRTQFARALKRRGSNQSEAAEVLGVSRPYVNQILSGQRTPSLEIAVRIEREYGIPARAFVEAA